LHGLVTAADVQDRDGGVLLLSTLFGQFPFLRMLFADSAYARPVFANGIADVMPNPDDLGLEGLQSFLSMSRIEAR
jgi:hypothetical protein